MANEIIAKATSVLVNENYNLRDIATSIDELLKFAKEPLLYEETKTKCVGLICQLKLKFRIIKYFDSPSKEVLDGLLSMIEKEIIPAAKKRNLNNTIVVAESIKYNMEIVDKAFSDVPAIKAKLAASDSLTVLDLDNIAKWAYEKTSSLKKLDLGIAFPYKIKSFEEFCQQTIQSIKDEAEKKRTTLVGEIENGLINKVSIDGEDLFDVEYEWFPSLSLESLHYAPCLIIYYPLVQDVELLCKNLAKKAGKKFKVLRSNAVFSLNKKEKEDLFLALGHTDSWVLLEGFEDIFDSKGGQELFTRIVEISKNTKVFISCTDGSGSFYSQAVNAGTTSGKFNSLDISSHYLSMPDYSSIKEILSSSFNSGDEQSEEEIKNTYVYLGYIGFNEVYSALTSGYRSKEKAASIAKINKPTITRYLATLRRQTLLIGDDWGDLSWAIPDSGKDFDYDDNYDFQDEYLNKIARSRVLKQIEKVGLAGEYALLCNNDISRWGDLPKKEKEDRLANTVKAIYGIYGINYIDPKAEIVPNNGKWGARCCDGGKLIQFTTGSVKDINTTLQTIFHETLHSLQHHMVNRGYFPIYFEWYGVLKHMVDQWRNNFNCYFSDTSTNEYRYQVIEAWAYAFEEDCFESIANAKIKFAEEE